MMCLDMGMAHEINNDTPCVLVAEVPAGLASLLLQKPQYLFSIRMYDALQAILTDEQKAALDEMSVEARPLVFKGAIALGGEDW